MPMIKLRAPIGATSISIAGTEFEVEDGWLEIPDIYRVQAETHGYGKRAEETNLDRLAVQSVKTVTHDQVAEMGRGDLLIYCDEHSLDIPPRSSLTDLRELVLKDSIERAKILAAASKKK